MWVLRRTYEPDQTSGVFYAHNNIEFKVLELPYRDNLPNVSCINEGEYDVYRDYDGRHKWFRLRPADLNLLSPGRKDIEFHGAGSVADLRGCIGFLDPRTALPVLASQVQTYEKLWICATNRPEDVA